MKIINKLVLSLVFLAVALVVPMLQVRADEDSPDEYWYDVTQKYYENGELKTDITYHFTSPHAVFYYKNPLGDYDKLILSYWTGENIMPVIIGENSYGQSNLSPYERTDYSSIRNPTVNLFDGSFTYQGKSYLYVNDLGNIKLFSSRAAAMAFFENGDDSGWLNKPKFEPDTSCAGSSDFSLSDVEFWNDDTYFYASWSGLTDYLGCEDISADFVFVCAGFYTSHISTTRDVGYYHLSDGFLKIPFSELTYYDSELSMIKLVPYHYAGFEQSKLYKGKSSSSYFNDLFYDDEWGTLYDPDCYIVNPAMNFTKGTSALNGTLSTFMGVELSNGFYSYSSRNMKYTFLWDGVNTSYEADLALSHMQIDIVCNDREFTFSDSGYSLSAGSVEITLQDILSFLQDNGVQPVVESFSIKYTPYYIIGRKTYHGRSCRFVVQANSSGVLQVSQADDSFDNDSDYSDIDVVSPSDLPIVVPGFTDNDSFEFDFSYDADNMFKNFFNSLRSLVSYCGQLPALINKVFSFLPDVYGNMIVIILAACFVMRLLGR